MCVSGSECGWGWGWLSPVVLLLLLEPTDCDWDTLLGLSRCLRPPRSPLMFSYVS